MEPDVESEKAEFLKREGEIEEKCGENNVAERGTRTAVRPSRGCLTLPLSSVPPFAPLLATSLRHLSTHTPEREAGPR